MVTAIYKVLGTYFTKIYY